MSAVRQEEARLFAEFFDGAEDIVPATSVECNDVVAQFIQNFVHLKRGEDGFDEDGHLDGAARNAELILREVEHVVPQTRFEMALQFGQVEIWTRAALSEAICIQKQIQAKVEERGGDGFATQRHVFFIQMPAARTHKQRRGIFIQFVGFFGSGEGDVALDRVAQIKVTLDEIFPGR